MLLFNKTAMFHSSSVTGAARKVQEECFFAFHPEHSRLTRGTCRSDVWMRGQGGDDDFRRVKGQLRGRHSSFNT